MRARFLTPLALAALLGATACGGNETGDGRNVGSDQTHDASRAGQAAGPGFQQEGQLPGGMATPAESANATLQGALQGNDDTMGAGAGTSVITDSLAAGSRP